MIHVCITGHRLQGIRPYLNQNQISITEFKRKIDKIINKYFNNKDKYIFHLGGSDGFDNIVGEILYKNNYTYELFVPFFDVNGRTYWSSKEIDIYNNIKKYAKEIHVINGRYLDRDKKLQQNTSILLAFKLNNRSGTKKTIQMWKERVTLYSTKTLGEGLILLKSKKIKGGI